MEPLSFCMSTYLKECLQYCTSLFELCHQLLDENRQANVTGEFLHQAQFVTVSITGLIETLVNEGSDILTSQATNLRQEVFTFLSCCKVVVISDRSNSRGESLILKNNFKEVGNRIREFVQQLNELPESLQQQKVFRAQSENSNRFSEEIPRYSNSEEQNHILRGVVHQMNYLKSLVYHQKTKDFSEVESKTKSIFLELLNNSTVPEKNQEFKDYLQIVCNIANDIVFTISNADKAQKEKNFEQKLQEFATIVSIVTDIPSDKKEKFQIDLCAKVFVQSSLSSHNLQKNTKISASKSNSSENILLKKDSLLRLTPGYRVEMGVPEETMPSSVEDLDLIDNEKYLFHFSEKFVDSPHQMWIGKTKDQKPFVVSVLCEGKKKILTLIRTREGHLLKNFECTLKELKKNLSKILDISELKIWKDGSPFISNLKQYENSTGVTGYRFGVLYCKQNQTLEEDMYSNEIASPDFEEFLEILGDKVALQGFGGYKGGLDIKHNQTGTHSIYRSYKDLNIMYHVSTMLPFTPNDKQQLERKRFVGYDIVLIVFQDEGTTTPFDPCCMNSEFNHIFVVIRKMQSNPTKYKISIITKEGFGGCVPSFEVDSIFEKNFFFKELLVTKLINSERSAYKSKQFKDLLIRTREELLLDFVTDLGIKCKRVAQKYGSNKS